jgi:hypothetical protein
MGWSNYIIIKKWKMLIEVSRDIGGIEDYEKVAIEKAISENSADERMYIEGENIIDMGDVAINKITIRDISELYKVYDIVQSLSGMSNDKLFLFWLKNRGIDFLIESEHNIDLHEYEREGYVRIRRE